MRQRVIALASLPLIVGITWSVSASSTTLQDYAKYTSDRWNFSIAVPADMTFAEYDGPGESQIIQFSNASADKVFEVSAEPYTQMDVALGEEGAPNAASDQSTSLGVMTVYHDDTLSFGFHRNGIAYTVTALPDDESWLLPILQSWEFTE